ncbi:winged helix-turn-helix transcriptional regulator [Streptomyces sp. NPDC057684]|uniref:winged helix-turn-helix transcriptional regulator n=1 Tax=Streptomyces sp. NPDC057684 TaxID=3346211 RepID=UPI0036B91541
MAALRRPAPAAPGVPQRTLTRTLALRHLERDGIVTLTVYAEVPPRVEYELTELGEGLRATVRAFTQWLTDHHGEIEAARARHDNA